MDIQRALTQATAGQTPPKLKLGELVYPVPTSDFEKSYPKAVVGLIYMYSARQGHHYRYHVIPLNSRHVQEWVTNRSMNVDSVLARGAKWEIIPEDELLSMEEYEQWKRRKLEEAKRKHEEELARIEAQLSRKPAAGRRNARDRRRQNILAVSLGKQRRLREHLPEE